MRRLLMMASIAVLAFAAFVPAQAEETSDQTVQTCAGMSSGDGNGTWSFHAGVRRVTFDGVQSLERHHCTYETTKRIPLDYLDDPWTFILITVLGSSGLTNSQIELHGVGDFTCASGGFGSLTSSGAGAASKVHTESYYEWGALSPILDWEAEFAAGVGKLTGTLHGRLETAPVTGTIVVNCADPGTGEANTVTALQWERTPR